MNEIKIGKYTLESLTTSMYLNPYIIYREYVQNSVDSIDEAVLNNVIKEEDNLIEIILNTHKNEIVIRDNGGGIAFEEATQKLLDIGNSTKKSSSNRGFRGIGRLAGLSYCDELVFETTCLGETKKSIISINSKKLRCLLDDRDNDESISEVIDQISEIEYESTNINDHYFIVKMKRLSEHLDIMNITKLEKFIAETLPVPYDTRKFKYGEIIKQFASENGYVYKNYNIVVKLNDGVAYQIYKPYIDNIIVDFKNKREDCIKNITLKTIENKKGKTVAIIWYSNTSMLGTIINKETKGLRYIKSGILIGDKMTASELFKEERFNGWFIGEIMIVDPDIIPNARRDYFDNNQNFRYLKNELKAIADELTKQIRVASYERTKGKKKLRNIVSKETTTDDGISKVLDKLDEIIEKTYSADNTYDLLREILAQRISKSGIEEVIVEMKKALS